MDKLERFEAYMDKRLEENKKNRLKSKGCIEILRSMSVGMSRTEKEAVEFAIRKIKQAKKAKRWKRKYLELREYLGVDSMITVDFDNEWAGMNVGEVADALNKLNIRKGGAE